MSRLYRYVGPDDIRRRNEGALGGDVVSGMQDVRDWAKRTGQEANAEGLIRSTYVVDEHSRFRIADYGSEHVACAAGGRIRAAGVAWFAITKKSVTIERIDNQSTGYCPEPASWAAVQAALDQAGIPHPGTFTTEIVFRSCEACGQRNIVRDDWYYCAVCDAELPRAWNFGSSTGAS